MSSDNEREEVAPETPPIQPTVGQAFLRRAQHWVCTVHLQDDGGRKEANLVGSLNGAAPQLPGAPRLATLPPGALPLAAKKGCYSMLRRLVFLPSFEKYQAEYLSFQVGSATSGGSTKRLCQSYLAYRPSYTTWSKTRTNSGSGCSCQTRTPSGGKSSLSVSSVCWHEVFLP